MINALSQEELFYVLDLLHNRKSNLAILKMRANREGLAGHYEMEIVRNKKISDVIHGIAYYKNTEKEV